jgi:peptidoglycan/LPS O-acetylase OafA/YrhL
MDASCPWFLALFALGMIAADIGFSQKPNLIKLLKALPWGFLTIIFILFAGVIRWKVIGLEEWIFAIWFSIAIACLMVYCSDCLNSGKKLPKILQILESPIAIALGGFSYSLYLTHAPILVLVRHFLLSLNISGNLYAMVFYLTGITMCLVFAYLFHLIFERRSTKIAT